MRVPINYSRAGVSSNMTPMIDVVFLLIIFFLVSSHLARQEVQLEMDLPDAGTGEPTGEDQTRRVVVNVLPDIEPTGRIMVAGRRMHPDELTRLIDYESRRADRQLEIRIRSDRTVPYGAVEPILLACARAGVWRVTFAVVGVRESGIGNRD